jgi:hypothetical protein
MGTPGARSRGNVATVKTDQASLFRSMAHDWRLQMK